MKQDISRSTPPRHCFSPQSVVCPPAPSGWVREVSVAVIATATTPPIAAAPSLVVPTIIPRPPTMTPAPVWRPWVSPATVPGMNWIRLLSLLVGSSPGDCPFSAFWCHPMFFTFRRLCNLPAPRVLNIYLWSSCDWGTLALASSSSAGATSASSFTGGAFRCHGAIT